MLEIKKILFPCGLAENLPKILTYVLSIAEKYNSMIYLFHVIDDNPYKWGIPPYYSFTFDKQKILNGAEKAMEKVCEEELQGFPNFNRKIVFGHPPTKILEAIESEGIDLVIMGTHGREGLDHAIFGSVAEKVIRKSPVPVLIINPYKLK
ncbi:MAG: universal stress protein [Deltaproteobacteria bacterium]|jgi:nucleotide-binding universal stress UspA family protein|nr:universal stress protein [Deltaproteobacteria bacterium]MBW1853576.1 universal stress protein [Deltaproteobacteria bacterium]MBW2184576.1 universal stress protein [Deltaproteobacteria bacterium]